MRTIAFLTARLPSKIANDLNATGYRVLEAFEIAEVMYLIEHEGIDAIIIDANVDEELDLKVVQLHRNILRVKPRATTQVVLWELANLFAGVKITQIQ